MATSSEVVVVLCTAPATHAESLAQAVVESRHAACVNVLPGVKSFYRWQGDVQQDDEVLLVCKTIAAKFAALRDRLSDLHPYDVPEVLALPVAAGLPAYLQWVTDSVEV